MFIKIENVRINVKDISSYRQDGSCLKVYISGDPIPHKFTMDIEDLDKALQECYVTIKGV